MRASARSLLFIALLLPATGGATPAFTLRTCFENSDSYPWLLQSGEGVVQYHLKAVATALDAEIVLTPLPWKRCLSRVSSGQMDAAIKMSYSVERATTVGVYPMREGKPDPAKRLLTESYSLYQLKGGVRASGMAPPSGSMAWLRPSRDFPSSTCCRLREPRWMTPAVTR